LTGKAKESHLLVQPHHQDCNHDIDGNLQVHQNDGAKTGQLGGLVPAVHLISMSMTHDSIEEACHENEPMSQLLPPPSLRAHCAILIDLEGLGMDDSLAPLRRWERGKVWKFGVEELEESGIGIGTE